MPVPELSFRAWLMSCLCKLSPALSTASDREAFQLGGNGRQGTTLTDTDYTRAVDEVFVDSTFVMSDDASSCSSCGCCGPGAVGVLSVLYSAFAISKGAFRFPTLGAPRVNVESPRM